MDWTAIAAVGTVAAAVIAYLQWRSSSRRSSSSRPPKILYKVLEGRGALTLPADWDEIAGANRSLWTLRSNVEDIRFALVLIRNRNDFAVDDIVLEIGAKNASYRVENSRKLAKSAIRFERPDEDTLHIIIPSLPAKDDIIISILGSQVGGSLKSANARIEIDTNWSDFDW